MPRMVGGFMQGFLTLGDASYLLLSLSFELKNLPPPMENINLHSVGGFLVLQIAIQMFIQKAHNKIENHCTHLVSSNVDIIDIGNLFQAPGR